MSFASMPPQQNQPLIGSPEAAEALCRRIAKTMETLITAIEEETRLVRAGKLGKAGELQSDKSALASQYVSDMAIIKRNAVALGRLAPATIAKLRERHEEFRSLLQINLAVLATARQVSEDLVRSVARGVGANQKPTTYGRTGAMGTGAAASAHGIACDRSG